MTRGFGSGRVPANRDPQTRKGVQKGRGECGRDHRCGCSLAIALLGGVTAALIGASVRAPAREARGEGALPPALAAHLAQVGLALPGNGGEPGEGPAAADEAKLAELAYPAADIPLAQIEAERAAFAKAKGKGFPKGKGKPGTWVSVGPSKSGISALQLPRPEPVRSE